MFSSSNLAELHSQVVWITAMVEQRFLKFFNDSSLDVVVWSRWKLETKGKIIHVPS